MERESDRAEMFEETTEEMIHHLAQAEVQRKAIEQRTAHESLKQIQKLEQDHQKEIEHMEETVRSLQEKIDKLEAGSEQKRLTQRHQQQLEDRVGQLEAEKAQLVEQLSVDRQQQEKKYVEVCEQRDRLAREVTAVQARYPNFHACKRLSDRLSSYQLKVQDLEDEIKYLRKHPCRRATPAPAPGITQGRQSLAPSGQSNQPVDFKSSKLGRDTGEMRVPEMLEVRNSPGAALISGEVDISSQAPSNAASQTNLPLLELLHGLSLLYVSTTGSKETVHSHGKPGSRRVQLSQVLRHCCHHGPCSDVRRDVTTLVEALLPPTNFRSQ